MMKKLLLPIIALFLFTHVGCSSSDVQEDSADVAASDDESFAEEGEGDFADGEESGSEETADAEESTDEESGEEVAEGEEELDAEEETEEVAEGEGEEELDAGDEEVAASDAEGDEELAMEEGDEESEFPEEVADETAVAENSESQPSDESLFTADNGSATPTEAPPEPPSTPADDLFKSSPNVAAAPTSFAPLQKIKDAPFERGGALLNRVYLARSGDTLKSISEKIYQSDRAKDLQKWNPGARKTPRVGDKIYYSSPRDPQDSSRMLTYYEDVGIAPQIHTTQDGDNIRTLGQTLLGNADGWKELWSTNLDIASKGALPAGVTVKYWPDSSAAPAPVMAATTPVTPPTDPTAPPVDPGQDIANNMPAPDPTLPTGDPMASLPPTTPEPMPGDLAGQDPNTGMVNSPDTAPPPPIAGITEPPVSPPEADPIKKKGPAPAEVVSASDDMTMMLGVVGVALVLLVGVFVIMKKNRARQIDLSQTQV